MEQNDLDNLESQVRELHATLADLADDFEAFVGLIHEPWFPSVAERFLLSENLHSMLRHAKALSNLKKALLSGTS